MEQAKTLLANITPRGRIVLAGSALAVLVVAFLMFRLASQPSYSLVVTGLDPAESGKVTSALDQKGIHYELRNNGTALAVDKSQVQDARVALAQQGLPGTSGPGFELFDKQKLGTSDFQQKITFQRALEGEIARTIGRVQGVTGAQVQLALPAQDVFSDTRRSPTAAVLLSGGSDALDPAAVRGIARLVASSVEGLKASDVTIADSGGRLLWPSGGGDAGDGAGTSKQALEARYNQELQARLNTLILQTVGPGKAQVQTHVDLDVDKVSTEELRYAKRGTPLRRQKESETLKGTGTGGAAGTAGNVPSYAQAGRNGSNNYKRSSEDVTYGVDKTVTRRQTAPGTVKNLTVALLVDKSVPEPSALRTAIAGAAGVPVSKISMSSVTFAKPPKAKSGSPVPPGVVGPAKGVGLGVAILAFLFFVRRHLRRREAEDLGDAAWLHEIRAPRTLAELESAAANGNGNGNGNGDGNRNGHADSPRRMVEDIVTREPAAIAQQVRLWMQD